MEKFKLTIFFLSIFVCISCNAQHPELKAVKIFNHWEFSISGKIQKFENSMTVIYSSRYMILKEPYTKMSEDGNLVLAGHRYFVLKKGEKIGLAFKSLESTNPKKYPVDSLIQNYLTTPSEFYNAQTKSPDSVFVNFNQRTALGIEKIVNAKTTELDQDTCYFFYNKINTGLTFYNPSTRIKHLFLYKCRIIFNAHAKGKISADVAVPKRELLFELTRDVVPDEEKIALLLKRFEEISIN